jgi:hypothetical protein
MYIEAYFNSCACGGQTIFQFAHGIDTPKVTPAKKPFTQFGWCII